LARAVFAILGGSEWLSDTLIRFPQLLDLAAQRHLLSEPKTWEQARTDCRDFCYPFTDRRSALRLWKSREMLRIGMRDLALQRPAPEITAEIADLAQACLSFACEEIARRRPMSSNITFAVLGMGKLGGGEMHYSSDCDVIFVYDVPPGGNAESAAREAAGWAEELMKLMGERTSEGVCFEVDARLRPDGRSGPLVRTVQGFIDYFERETNGIAAWERQALTRARFVAGDRSTSARLQAAIRHVAFPESWTAGWGDELRHIKSRVENERGKGAYSGAGNSAVLYDVKLGPGALSDIEFCAQWTVMRNGAKHPDLQTPNTLRQIDAAHAANLFSDDEAAALRDAYTFLRRAELRLQVTQEQGAKAVRAGTPAFTTWARAVFPDDQTSAETRFAEEWKARTSAARAVMQRVRDEL
jgi:glutamate-ammonia-ligase adenylyltransferase